MGIPLRAANACSSGRAIHGFADAPYYRTQANACPFLSLMQPQFCYPIWINTPIPFIFLYSATYVSQTFSRFYGSSISTPLKTINYAMVYLLSAYAEYALAFFVLHTNSKTLLALNPTNTAQILVVHQSNHHRIIHRQFS